MAGYSVTPLARKLGIREASRLRIVHPPGVIDELEATLPAGVEVLQRPRTPVDVIVAFFTSRRRLEQEFAGLAAGIVDNGGVWIGWPKRTSGVATDLDENIVREIGLEAGLVDNKVCAIDPTWSGLRFVIRIRDRASPHFPDMRESGTMGEGALLSVGRTEACR